MELTKSPYETYNEWEKRVFCDNASRRGSGISLNPQCFSGKREYECTITYNLVEKDNFVLCKECRDNLKKEARRYNYKFSSKALYGKSNTS